MSFLATTGYLLLGFVLLFAGGEGLIRGSAALGLRLGLTPVTTGLTIVAFGTSTPELAVSLRAAAAGIDGLAIGNVVGSNICNIALILGLTAILRPISVESVTVKREVPVMILASLALVAFLLDGRLSRIEGAVLIAGLLVYLIVTVRRSRAARSVIQKEFGDALPKPSEAWWPSILLMIVGLGAIVAGGMFFVRGAVGAAGNLGVSPAVIGLTVVAVGTSLPEIATSLVAAFRGYGDMAGGNVIGSNIFNILGILGITAVVLPLSRGAVNPVDLGVMLAVSLVAIPMMLSRGRIGRWEGGFLLAMYVAYLAWLVASHP